MEDEPIEWKICLDCQARNHPQNWRCDECGSISMTLTESVKEPLPEAPPQEPSKHENPSEPS